jgi:EAL domain-containing protein (putative c-di-GMP-specific phosphodiesterase class I)
VFVSASIGLALDTDRSHAPDDLLREADLAMYRAKSAGKSRYEIFDPGMSTHAMERLDLETDLRHAAERGELVVYYQPQFDLASGQIESIEALLRWRHPRRGVLQPSDFMPLAEESGRSVELGRWCLEQACRDAAGWQLRLPGVPVVVNLSVRHLDHLDLLTEVTSVLAQTGLLPELLTLEIAESAAMRDAAATAETLRALRQLGPRIVLDQFGNGYSSLAYLTRFPIDALKIEGGIVAHLEDLESRALVRGVVALARALNLRVGADDVATADQAAQLRALGCQTAQGDAFGAPCPVSELVFVGTAAAA